MSGKKRKRMSYTADFKLKVVKLAEQTSNLEAGRQFGIEESNVRRWRKDTSLDIAPKNKRANRGRKHGQYPEMEKEIFEWFKAQRQNGYGVSLLGIRMQAIKIAQSKKYEDFTASQGWCIRFLKRHSIRLRQSMNIAQKLPSQYEHKLLDFQKYVIDQRKAGDFPLCRIGNMIETPMCFDMPSTVPQSLQMTGNEKTHFTVILACTADGGKLPPMVIFKRKTLPKDKFPSGVIIHQHPKGCMDEEGVMKWLDQVWVRRNGGLLKKPSLLVWDQFEAHLTEKVKTRLKESETTQAVIPRGLTGMLQPLEVSLNKPFKTKMRNLWMAEGKAELTANGNFKRSSLHTVVSWVKTAWDEISREMIQKSFLKCGISNKLDGTEDDYLWQEETQETPSAREDHAEAEDGEEVLWDDDNVQFNSMYTDEEWKKLFGESDDECDSDNDIERF